MADARDLQLRKRQIAGLILLALFVLAVTLARRHAALFPPGWWRW